MLEGRNGIANEQRVARARCVAALACLALGACATDPDAQDLNDEGQGKSVDGAPEETQVDGAPEDLLAAIAVRGVELTATGSGCPAGTYKASVSADGQSLDIRFSDYGGALMGATTSLREDCTLSLKVPGKEGVSYYPQAVTVAGTSEQAGVSFAASVYWAGAPDQRADLTRTADPGFAGWQHSQELRSLKSSCGSAQELRIDSKVEGTLDTANRYGKRGKVGVGSLRVKLRSATCGAAVPPPEKPVTPPPGNGPLPASGVTIRSVQAFGSGCPAGTAHAVVAPDGQNFTVEFDGFALTPGQRTSAPYCGITIDAVAPNGKAYAIESYTIRGSAELPAGVAAEISGEPRFPTVSGSLESIQYTKLSGPSTGAIAFEQKLEAGDLQFSECGRQLNAQLGVRATFVRDASGAAVQTGSVTIGEVGPFKFATRDCTP